MIDIGGDKAYGADNRTKEGDDLMEKKMAIRTAVLIAAAIVAATVIENGYDFVFAKGAYNETTPVEGEILTGEHGRIIHYDEGLGSCPKMEYSYDGMDYDTDGSIDALADLRSHEQIKELARGDSDGFYFRYYVVPRHMTGCVDMIEGFVDGENVLYHTEQMSYTKICYDTKCVILPGEIVAIHTPNAYKYVGGCLLFPILAFLIGGMLCVMAMVALDGVRRALRKVKKHGL